MPETTYLPQVRCEISESLTGSDKTICVRDVDGRRQYIHVLPSLVNSVSDTPYLPVGVINVDYRNNREIRCQFIILIGKSGVSSSFLPEKTN